MVCVISTLMGVITCDVISKLWVVLKAKTNRCLANANWIARFPMDRVIVVPAGSS